jgi:hypothetical protein
LITAPLPQQYSGKEFHHDEISSMDPKTRAEFMGRSCYFCFKTNASMQKCARCVKAHYCSKECQLTHWPLHKKECVKREKTSEK